MDPIVSLQGRTIVVTGAGQGIGKGIVELAIELGANVVAVDLNGQTLDAAVSPLPQARVLAVQGSVADPAVADRAVTEAVAKFGAVHGLVNNAGIIRPAMIDKMTDQQWQEVIDVHLTGSFYWMRATGRHMVERSKGGERTGGSIVNISSDAGRKGSIGQINYAAAKAGMLGMTMTTARELAPLLRKAARMDCVSALRLRAAIDWTAANREVAGVAFVALYVVATVAFVPGLPLTLAAGAIFGLAQGFAAVLLGEASRDGAGSH